MEFWFAIIKVLTIVGLIILGIILDAGGGPDKVVIGFSVSFKFDFEMSRNSKSDIFVFRTGGTPVLGYNTSEFKDLLDVSSDSVSFLAFEFSHPLR